MTFLRKVFYWQIPHQIIVPSPITKQSTSDPKTLQEVIRLETQYWTLVDIPKQEKQETVPAFVLRACAIMEKTQKSGEGVKTSAKLAEEAQDKHKRIERLESKYIIVFEDLIPKTSNCLISIPIFLLAFYFRSQYKISVK